MPAKQTSRWYNYVTEETDSSMGNPKDYIPQTVPSLGMYDAYIELGKAPKDAMLKVLDSWCRKRGNDG